MENKFVSRNRRAGFSYPSLYLLFILFMILQSGVFGQNIPDEKFAKAIRASCSMCIDSADNLTAHAKNITYLNIEYQNITNLVGIAGFSSLQHLDCSNNKLTHLPALPQRLKILYCSKNQLTALPNLPQTLEDLTCSKNQLTTLPFLPNNLRFLTCSENEIARLPVLPNGLRYLVCHNNLLSQLSFLPPEIQIVECYNNPLYCMPYLPNSLLTLAIDVDKVTCLPNTVANLVVLNTSLSPTKTPPTCVSPTIQSQIVGSMSSDAICEGQKVTLKAKAVGIGHLTAKWQRKKATEADFSNISFSEMVYTSDTESSFTSPELHYLDNNVSYRCMFVNCNKTVFTDPVTIKVNPSVMPSVLLTFSTNTTVNTGTRVNLQAQSWNAGSTPVYQWLINDEVVKDEIGTILKLNDPNNDYSVKVQMISNADCRTSDTVVSNVLTLQSNKLIVSPEPIVAAINPPIASETQQDKPTDVDVNKRLKKPIAPPQTQPPVSIHEKLPKNEEPVKVSINNQPKNRVKKEGKVEKIKTAVLVKASNEMSSEFVKFDAPEKGDDIPEKIKPHPEIPAILHTSKIEPYKAFSRNDWLVVSGLGFLALLTFWMYRSHKTANKGDGSEA